MTRVFLDANVLVAVLNKEYPAFDPCSRVLSLSGHRRFLLYCSTLTLGIVYYFAEKKHGTGMAKKKMKLLLDHIGVTDCGEQEARLAIANKKAHDFEDAMQYYSAVHAGCKAIVTMDTGGYYYSSVAVQTPENFLKSLSRLG